MMFDERYEVILADTPESRREHYRLRYRVYCLETGFEDPSHFPNGEERDAHDAHAAHFLVRSRDSGRYLAGLRLVLPQPGSDLPIQNLGILDSGIAGMVERGQVAEVSRVCQVRRPVLDKAAPGVLAGGQEIMDTDRNQPGTLFALVRAAFFYCLEHDIHHLLFLIRPAMARMIGRMHIPLAPAGTRCEHRGIRYPFCADLYRAAGEMTRDCPALAHQLRYSLAYTRHSELADERRRLRLVS
jgi:N-acyl amino acid synthase of PEP-CTERM/exosortase system